MDPKQLRSQDHNIPSEGGRPRPALLHSPPSSPGHARLSPAPLRGGPAPTLRPAAPARLQSARASEEPKKAGAWCARERRGALALLFLVCLEPRI